MNGPLRTRLWRWRESVSTVPVLFAWQQLLQALRGQNLTSANELPVLPPLFVLSTGRCGTFTLTHLLSLAPRVSAFHEPQPILSDLAQKVTDFPDVDHELVAEALLLARRALWKAGNLAGKRYVETAHYTSFLAPSLLHLMPDARFLHLTRAPAAFVRSALGYGFYARPLRATDWRQPRPGTSAAATWESRDPCAKNVWYWQEVNTFARDFLRALPPGQGLHLRSEDIFSADPGALRQLYAMVDSEAPPRRRIQRVLGRQLNAGRYRSGYRPVGNFTPAQRDLLERECGDLARELGYAGIDC